MFRGEDAMSMLANLRIVSLEKLSNPYYHRASFAALLAHIKPQVTCNWDQVYSKLLELIANDRSLMIGSTYLQELYLYMHLFGLSTADAFGSGFRHYCQPVSSTPLSEWKDIPPVLSVTMQVPRQTIEAFSRLEPTKMGSPALCCMVQSSASSPHGAWCNAFAALQVGFGKLTTTATAEDDDYTIIITPDSKTWSGTSDMIVSFMAPTWMILQEPSNARISLALQSTPYAAVALNKIFPMLQVFNTTLGSRSVHLTKYMPNLQRHPMVPLQKPESALRVSSGRSYGINTEVIASHDSSRSKIASLSYKLELVDNKLKSLLAEKETSVECVQASGSRVDIQLGKRKFIHAADLPVPVVVAKSKTRIARKSGYIELIVPLASSSADSRLSNFMFPVALMATDLSTSPHVTKALVNWNMPFVNLDTLPTLDTKQPSKLQWLNTHTTLMFSSRERKIREADIARPGMNPTNADVRTDMKDGLFSIFMHSSGLQGGRARYFGLHKPDEGGVHVMIFVSALRLDLSNYTVLLDAAVLPLTAELMRKPLVPSVLGSLQTAGLAQIKVGADELRLWKTNLPSFVERCRTWSHRPQTCEYAKANQVPLMTGLEDGKTPLCSCGLNNLPKGFIKEPKIPKLNEVLRLYATRAAIAPCFAVPYVEECFEALKEVASAATGPAHPALTSTLVPGPSGSGSTTAKAGGQGGTRGDATNTGPKTAEQTVSAAANEVLRKMQTTGAPHCQICGWTEKKGNASKSTSDGGGASSLLRCGKCRMVWYCSAECQKTDWKGHKPLCQLMVQHSEVVK